MLAELGIAPDVPTANGHEDNRAPGKKKKKEKKDKLAGGEQPKQEEAEPEAVERPAAVIEVGRLFPCKNCAVHCCCVVQAVGQSAASLSEIDGADNCLLTLLC